MAQRLVRRLCEKCKTTYQPDAANLPADFPLDALDGQPLYRNVGCRECRNSGYSGRMGIYELMITTDEVRQLAHDHASSWKIKQAAVKGGMDTLRDDGWKKVIEGRTSVEEILRVTKGDRQVVK